MRRNAVVTAAQRRARQLLMIGMVIAAYFVLSLFDQAARADGVDIGVTQKGDSSAAVKKLTDDVVEFESLFCGLR